MEGLSASGRPFAFGQIEELLACARAERAGLCQLGRDLCGQLVADRLILRRGSTTALDFPLSAPGVAAVPQRNVELESRLLPRSTFDGIKDGLGGSRAAFDADRIGKSLVLRSTKPGDRFCPLGMTGHKKISDFLVDIKWPRILRDQVLVLTSGGEIAWVVGARPSHTFRVRRDTTTVLLVEASGLEYPV